MAVIPLAQYETVLQERLNAPMVWKEITNVNYTDVGIVKNPYLTDTTQSTGTRGTGYTSVAAATVDESLTISTYVYNATHIDDADMAQKTFSDFMAIADNMATVLNEGMETAMLAEHAQWTNIDGVNLGLAAGNITVAISNIKQIIAAVKTAIRNAGGKDMAERKGIFIQWREADFEKVELLASSEGFNVADDALKNGIKQGFKYLGVEHYSTSKNVATHVFAGVKGAMDTYVVKSTYGKVKQLINPVVGGAQISGIGLESRIDRAFKCWNKMTPIAFDVNVV